MFSLGAFTFLSPWLLAALVAVPVLWWILRITPPRPKTVRLPTLFLMQDLATAVKSAAKTPWWLLVLRAFAVICIIFALSDPVIKISNDLPGTGGTVLIAIDNGWESAAHWDERAAKIREYLPQLRREGRSVMILPTAAAAQDGKPHSYGVMDAGEAEKFINQLKPQPWPADYTAALPLADDIVQKNKISHTLFFSGGLNASDIGLFLEKLREGGGLTVFNDKTVNAPFIMRQAAQKPGQLAFALERLSDAAPEMSLSLTAYGSGGGAIDTYKFSFPAGQKNVDVKWDIMKELRSDVARVSLDAPQMASSTVLTDSQWQQHPVGIVAEAASETNEGFLNEVYYLKRALEAGGALDIGTPDDLLRQPLSAIIWPDSAALTVTERDRLQKWVEEEGGFLIRFAGPNLAANSDDPLLPVPLRFGERAMQGAMTWEKPIGLGKVPDESPLLGLDVPKDVTITRQVLANPVPEVFEKTWLQLDDGTPLITGGPVGKGVVALVHTTAGPDWSNFCYSGLYVETLQRMASLGAGISGYKAQNVLPPMMTMDGFGRLQPADSKSVVAAIDPRQVFKPSPANPPGLYGSREEFQVFNLGDALPGMQPLGDLPSGSALKSYQLSGEKNLKADFFKIALWLLLLDTLVTFWLRGVLSLPSRRIAAVFLLGALLHAGTATAQAVDKGDLVSTMYLAYIETGDQSTDQTSYNGLSSLKNVINARTNIRIKGVQGVNPASDELFYYPVLYWPMTEAQGALSMTAARNIQTYLAQGGMILIDTRDQQFAGANGDLDHSTPGTRQLRKLTESFRIAELMPVGDGHILTKSFYLLDSFPGLYDGGKLWVEKEPSPNFDAVTSILIGGNDWAAAWSDDDGDRSRFSLAGGERQREQAYRFGVNLMMAALAGNYKADQVHVPYILERLGK